MEKGYQQVLENMVYESLKILKEHGIDNFQDESWEKLDEILEITAETYNKDIEDVAQDYQDMLESALLKIIYG